MGVSDSTLRWLDGAAAALHGAQALAVIGLTVGVLDRRPRGLFDGGHIAVYRTATVFNATGGPGSDRRVGSGELDTRWLIACFFLLSAGFGLCGALLAPGPGARTLWRFGEYSVSASVMLLAIASQAGIRDVYTLGCQFVLVWVTQVLGVLAEWAQTDRSPWGWLPPHLAAWVTCVAAYAPVLDCFGLNAAQPENKIPDFVQTIVFLELALFASFGLVQTAALWRKATLIAGRAQAHYPYRPVDKQDSEAQLADVDADSELAYTVLSLAAKSLLAWIVLAPLLAQ